MYSHPQRDSKIWFTSYHGAAAVETCFERVFDNMITEKKLSDPSIMSFATIIFWQTYDLTLQLDSQVHYKLSLVSVRTIG